MDEGRYQAKDQLLVAIDNVVTGDTHQLHLVSLQTLQCSRHILKLVDAHLPFLSWLRDELKTDKELHTQAFLHELAKTQYRQNLLTTMQCSVFFSSMYIQKRRVRV